MGNRVAATRAFMVCQNFSVQMVGCWPATGSSRICQQTSQTGDAAADGGAGVDGIWIDMNRRKPLALTQHKYRSSYVKLWEASAVAVLYHDLVLATVG